VSYDLFFRSRSPEMRFSCEDFVRYFMQRPWYEAKESQAVYWNEDSGVYFYFEYSERSGDSEVGHESDSSLLPVTFSLNYFRPHPFGLEAELEVAAFIEAFDLTVSDPQVSGMGDGEYSKEGFLRGWNAGNAVSYQAILSHYPSRRFLTLPSSRIEAFWRWNFNRKARQIEIGNTAFVPRIFFFDIGGEVQTGVAWVGGMPILLPFVDLVFVIRQRLASPQSGFRPTEDIVVFSWRELESIIRRFRKISGELEAYELCYEVTPMDIERAVFEKQPPAKMPERIAFDQVLNRELLEQARGS
jgi:hypothetical protein